MSYYINPPDCTKEEFLEANATWRATGFDPHKQGDDVLVCLVDNGMFTAAGICYSDGERQAFAHPDGRYKIWFYVPLEKLRPFLFEQEIE